MHYMGLNEIREKYLSFFESKDHLRMPSFSLVPQNDKSILLINAGMTPLKPYFKGEETPPRKRVTTCQKCIRTPDIERIGKTARHGTFFEMLGNFSFGDYFKAEVIPWAWEFMTKVMEIPEEKLHVTVYHEDDEAYNIWHNVVGLPESHISRFGKEDNFWEHGEGPCGPCSEIFFDRGPEKGCGSPDCKVGCDCDRFMEVWNLVFTQFNNDGNGNYERLKNCNIDTGMGLERLACVMQGVDSLFDVDTVRNITARLSEMSSKKYGDSHETDVSLRIITDHTRSTTFMVSDGILPSNEGRGYVVRRLLRRAARHGKLLGIKSEHFLSELAKVVIRESGDAYPELKEKENFIINVIDQEEARFNQTIDSGLAILNELIAKAESDGKKTISGEDAFRLYDTFGFPLDLTLEILEEKGMSTDEAAFNACMDEQKKRAREAYLASGASAWKGNEDLKGLPQTEFLGYDTLVAEATVLKVLTEEDGSVTVITDKTPFYGESGGQVGDRGVIETASAKLEVTDTKKANGIFLHKVTILEGIVSEGDTVTLTVNKALREATRRNHSSAHLLQSALKEVLGSHVAQAGSYVDEHRMRFDFSHFAALTSEEIAKVENIVNNFILEGYPVVTEVMKTSDAKQSGATALFGEKYGEFVRVVSMGDVSKEFCGGTHVDNTSKIGLFKIISEAGIAAGVRRIEALTGMNVLEAIAEKDKAINETAAALKTNAKEITSKAEALMNELKTANKQIADLNAKLSASGLDDIVKNAETIGAFSFITGKLSADANTLRTLGDDLRAKYDNAVILLFAENDGKVNIVVSCGKEAVKNGAHAGNIVKEAAKICLGGGGGRPDGAMAGGKDASKIPEAVDAVKALLSK